MKTGLYQTLASVATEPRLSGIIGRTIDFLNEAEIRREHFAGNGQPAKQVSDLHAFRKRIGYYKQGALVGLDETIDSLAHVDGNVRLGVIETDRGAVALWLDEHGSIVGVMITKMVRKPD